MANPKPNPATQAVQMAQARYPKLLASVVGYFGPTPYGVEVVDQRTADRRLAKMTPDDMANLAATNPQAAESAAERIQVLDARRAALPPLPAQDEYVPE